MVISLREDSKCKGLGMGACLAGAMNSKGGPHGPVRLARVESTWNRNEEWQGSYYVGSSTCTLNEGNSP